MAQDFCGFGNGHTLHIGGFAEICDKHQIRAPGMIERNDADTTHFQQTGQRRRRAGGNRVIHGLQRNLIVGNEAKPAFLDKAKCQIALSAPRGATKKNSGTVQFNAGAMDQHRRIRQPGWL